VRETIEETTVAEIGGVRVGMGNMTRGSYEAPDGPREGVICSLALPGKVGVFVGLGSVIDIGGHPWTVVAIEKPPGERGEVTLERRPGLRG